MHSHLMKSEDHAEDSRLCMRLVLVSFTLVYRCMRHSTIDLSLLYLFSVTSQRLRTTKQLLTGYPSTKGVDAPSRLRLENVWRF